MIQIKCHEQGALGPISVSCLSVYIHPGVPMVHVGECANSNSKDIGPSTPGSWHSIFIRKINMENSWTGGRPFLNSQQQNHSYDSSLWLELFIINNFFHLICNQWLQQCRNAGTIMLHPLLPVNMHSLSNLQKRRWTWNILSTILPAMQVAHGKSDCQKRRISWHLDRLPYIFVYKLHSHISRTHNPGPEIMDCK